MGAFRENLEYAYEGYRESRRERLKWAPLLLGFIAVTFLAGFVKDIFVGNPDILGGTATVEK